MSYQFCSWKARMLAYPTGADGLDGEREFSAE